MWHAWADTKIASATACRAGSPCGVGGCNCNPWSTATKPPDAKQRQDVVQTKGVPQGVPPKLDSCAMSSCGRVTWRLQACTEPRRLVDQRGGSDVCTAVALTCGVPHWFGGGVQPGGGSP